MTHDGTHFKLEGRVVVDSSNDGNFAFGQRGGGYWRTYITIYENAASEQEWYGDGYSYKDPFKPEGSTYSTFYWYRPSYVFPPNWNPNDPGC